MQLNLTKEAAESLIALYFKAFPRVKNYIDNSHKFAIYNQMAITPLGQRKRQYGTYDCFKQTAAYNGSLRNSQNVIIQSATSTIGLVTFAEINNQIKKLGGKSICTVFDSWEAQVPLEKAAEVINLVYNIMNTYPQQMFPFMELPIGCEGDVGISWGETEVVHAGVTQLEIEEIVRKIKAKSIVTFGGDLY